MEDVPRTFSFDVSRTTSFDEFVFDGDKEVSLRNVLLAYAHVDTDVRYVQVCVYVYECAHV